MFLEFSKEAQISEIERKIHFYLPKSENFKGKTVKEIFADAWYWSKPFSKHIDFTILTLFSKHFNFKKSTISLCINIHANLTSSKQLYSWVSQHQWAESRNLSPSFSHPAVTGNWQLFPAFVTLPRFFLRREKCIRLLVRVGLKFLKEEWKSHGIFGRMFELAQVIW